MLGTIEFIWRLVEITMMNMNFDNFEQGFGRKLLIDLGFLEFYIFCFICNLQGFVMLIVFDYLFKMKNGFFQEFIILFLSIKLAIQITNLEMNFNIQRLQLNEFQ